MTVDPDSISYQLLVTVSMSSGFSDEDLRSQPSKIYVVGLQLGQRLDQKVSLQQICPCEHGEHAAHQSVLARRAHTLPYQEGSDLGRKTSGVESSMVASTGLSYIDDECGAQQNSKSQARATTQNKPPASSPRNEDSKCCNM
eukprot:4212360-Amphidinium_carterae.1